jgi:hypothetical protein
MRRLITSFLVVMCTGASALAWSAHGHRTITYLALEGLPSEMPEWVRDASVRHRIADNSNEPDRWRGTDAVTLAHENGPDHYIDIEDLKQFGLTLETVSPFRYEYMRDMAVAMYVHPEQVAPVDESQNKDKSKPWPGFLPHAIQEHYNKLKCSFNTYRILLELNDPARAEQLANAKENCIYEMGILAHFIGDTAQPLHTTTHHHGWIGDNPNGYTRERGIHSYIDGAVVDLHHITVESLRPMVKYSVTVDGADPWKDTLAYIKRSFEQVEPLYRLEKDKLLTKEEGKKFIEERLADAGATLSAYYAAAWKSSTPTEREIQAWVKFNNFDPKVLPSYKDGEASIKPSTTPTPSSTPPPPAPPVDTKK